MNELIQHFTGGVRSLLAPSGTSCMSCQAGLANAADSAGLPLCRRCFSRIPWIRPEQIRCAVCGRYEACPDCPRRRDAQFVCNRSAVRYTDEMKEWLVRLKYRGDERLQALFAGMFRTLFHQFLTEHRLKPKDIAFATYVPLSRERLEERGFNQSQLFAGALSAPHRLPVLPLLHRIRHTGKMSYKSRAERLYELRGAFAIDERILLAPLLAAYDHHPAAVPPIILLIDDVYTTGSTLQECARIIQSAIPSRIYGLTWAR